MIRQIIITGAGGFLGSKFSEFFSNRGYFVIAIDKNKKKLNQLKNKNLKKICADITKEKNVLKIYNTLRKNSNICGLINNAAIDAVPIKNSLKNLKYPELKTWQSEIDVSLIGTFLMIKYFGELMLKKNKGSIINIGSDLSLIAPNQKIYKNAYENYIKPPTYSVIKHGLVGLTKYYASLYGISNVRVNMISPGAIKNSQNKKLQKEIKNLTPMNRLGEYHDLFSVIDLLISDGSKFITGQNIFIDGGRTII